jgi:hypothetical protein
LAREHCAVDFCGEQVLLADLKREGYICEIRLIWPVGVRIIRIRIWESEPDRKSEADEHRIRPKKAMIGKEAAINEETIIREEAAVDKSTTNEAWTVKLVKSATLKTHITALKTSRTTAMKAPTTKAPTAKTSVTNTDRRHRE